MKKDSPVLIKLSESEKEAFKRAGEISGLSLSAWARQIMREQAIKVLLENGEKVPFLISINQSK